MSKEFYKMNLVADECGLVVYTRIFLSIHETPCFHFCIRATEKGFLSEPLMLKNESKFQAAKRMGMKVFRIHKSGSRIAFETEEKAFKQLRMLKSKQIEHMRRTIAFNDGFLTLCKSFDDLLPNYKNDVCKMRTVPETKELVNGYYVFE